jgi:hypothetical protein
MPILGYLRGRDPGPSGRFASNLPVPGEDGKIRNRRDLAIHLSFGEGRFSTCAVTRRRFSSGNIASG